MPATNIEMTIPAGQSLSNAASVANAIGLYLITPTDWSPAANLTFQFSADGSSFFDLWSMVTRSEAMAGMKDRLGTISALEVDIPKGADAAIKLRSGTRNMPVEQDADRTFTLIVVT